MVTLVWVSPTLGEIREQMPKAEARQAVADIRYLGYRAWIE